MAAINFCSSECEVDEVSNTVSISRLFLWYKLDFVADDDDTLLLK